MDRPIDYTGSGLDPKTASAGNSWTKTISGNNPISTGQNAFSASGGTTPTVVTDANIRENKIGDITSKSNALVGNNNSQANQTTGQTGNQNNQNSQNTSSTTQNGGTDYSNMSYEQIYNDALGKTNGQPVDPSTTAILKSISDMKTSSDASTAAQLDAITKTFADRQSLQQRMNEGTTGQLRGLLESAGGYRSGSGIGILSAKEHSDIMGLTQLNNEELTAKAAVLKAQNDLNFQLMDKANNKLQDIQDKKATLAGKIADNISARNKDIMDRTETAKSDAMKLAVQNNAPQSIKDAVSNAKNATEAYAAISGYGGGSNIDIQKITNIDGTTSLVRVDKNTGKIISSSNVGGDQSSGSGSTSSTTAGLKDTTQFMKGLTVDGAQNFAKLSSQDKSNVMQLINGEALLSDLFTSRGTAGSALRQSILQKAQSVDPNFSENTNKIRYDFKKNWDNDAVKGNVGVRTAINTGLGHLADFKTNTDSMDKESLKSINSVSNWWNMETNNPAILKAQTDVTALAGEIAKAYNEDTVSGIEKWTKILGLDFSKGGISSVENEASKLLTSKITSLRYTYKTAMGKENPQSVIDPDKKQALLDAGIDPNSIANEKTGEDMSVKIGAARSSGHTDDDILSQVETDPAYSEKISAAKAAGYSAKDILDFLSK